MSYSVESACPLVGGLGQKTMTTSPGRVASFGLLLGVAVCTAEGTTTNAVGVAQAQAQAQTQAHKTLSRSHTVETTGSSSRVEPAVLDSINKHKDMVEAHYEGEDFFYDNQGETVSMTHNLRTFIHARTYSTCSCLQEHTYQLHTNIMFHLHAYCVQYKIENKFRYY